MQNINYDAEFCGRVPLHQTNMIQPHGVLLVLDRRDGKIIQASENAESLFGIPFRDLVSTSISNLIADGEAENLQSLLSRTPVEKQPFSFSVKSRNFFATVKSAGPFAVMEVEHPAFVQRDAFSFGFPELKEVMTAIDKATSVEETCTIAILELKRISGFDKVMVYRFDAEWNGDVIAEVREEEMEAYLGLKFPASDIPRQARELYLRTPYRLIPNREYEAVRLYPVINPLTNAFTDLSDSNLRSVAGVHLEYLENMGVMASMSTRIMVEGKLWGLIACHHRQPKYLSYQWGTVFELLSLLVSARISAMQLHDYYVDRDHKQEIFTRLVEQVYKENDLPASFRDHTPEWAALLQADGLALVWDGQTELNGLTPSEAEVADLVYWLSGRKENGVYHQTHLSSVYEPALSYAARAAGLLALPLKGEKDQFLLAFRSEAIQKVAWGGNPAEAIQFEADQKNYHPRASFQQWQQTVESTSLPWEPAELEMATRLMNFLRSIA